MDPIGRAQEGSSPEGLDFVRFCYRRRRVGWPELYDEMCAVAGRGIYQGWTHADLAERGIGFSLFEMPALAALVGRVVAEEAELRRSLGGRLVARPEVDRDLTAADRTDPGADGTARAVAHAVVG